jgi:hypothetical protein
MGEAQLAQQLRLLQLAPGIGQAQRAGAQHLLGRRRRAVQAALDQPLRDGHAQIGNRNPAFPAIARPPAW